MLAAPGCPKAQIEGTYNARSYDAERRRWLSKLATHLERLERENMKDQR